LRVSFGDGGGFSVSVGGGLCDSIGSNVVVCTIPHVSLSIVCVGEGGESGAIVVVVEPVPHEGVYTQPVADEFVWVPHPVFACVVQPVGGFVWVSRFSNPKLRSKGVFALFTFAFALSTFAFALFRSELGQFLPVFECVGVHWSWTRP
jgi:hypothetical protein